MPRAHLNGPLNRQVTCAILLVGVTHAFGMVGHVQQSVRRIWLFLKTTILCFGSHSSLVVINLAMYFIG